MEGQGDDLEGSQGPMPDQYESVCGDGDWVYTYNGDAYLFFYSNYYYNNECPYGYTPVVINDAAENEWVYQRAADEFGGESTYWIGLTYDWERNGYYWVNPWEQPTFRDWASGQPYSGDGEECTAVNIYAEHPAWYLTYCDDDYKHFVCEACGADTDGDGHGDRCDCAPNDGDIYPGAEEILENGIDDNCNGQIDEIMEQPDDDSGYPD
jgi:hypothetical protein